MMTIEQNIFVALTHWIWAIHLSLQRF